MKQNFLACAALALAIALAGCGGGNGISSINRVSGTASAPVTPGQTLQFGALTTRVAGTVQPPVTGGGNGVVVTGIAGALVSSMTIQSATPILANSKILYQRYDSNLTTSDIWATGPDGNGNVNLTKNPTGILSMNPTFSPDGSRIAFSTFHNGHSEFWMMNADGSNTQKIPFSSAGISDFGPHSWSPDGTRLVFTDGLSIWTISADGLNLQNMMEAQGDGTQFDAPSWSPDGKNIAFLTISASLGKREIWLAHPDGSGQRQMTSPGDTNQYLNPIWSPDGTQLACLVTVGSQRSSIGLISVASDTQLLITSATGEDSLAWSPDGTWLTGSILSNGNYSLEKIHPNGTGQQIVLSSVSRLTAPNWGGGQISTLVGTGGTLGGTAAGFLVGQSGQNVTGIVAFDTPSSARTTARVSAQTGLSPGLPNVVFTVNADALSSLAYVNGLTAVPHAIPLAAGVNGALVTFDAGTGGVTSIMPYTANRSADVSSSPTAASGVLTLRRHFLGVWDSTGENRAPNGASAVQVDAHTGKLLSIQ